MKYITKFLLLLDIYICLFLMLFFILTEKRRDAPNGKLFMIIDKKVLNYNLILVDCIFIM